jgi:hypothetical protein
MSNPETKLLTAGPCKSRQIQARESQKGISKFGLLAVVLGKSGQVSASVGKSRQASCNWQS